MQDIHNFYTWSFISCSFRPVSPNVRYLQVLHMIFYYMFLQACVSKCKIFTSFTHDFLLHTPSCLFLQVQDIHKFYTWFFMTCSFRPVFPSARYSQDLHMVFYDILLQACVSKYKILTSFTHGFYYMLLQACVSKCKIFTSCKHGSHILLVVSEIFNASTIIWIIWIIKFQSL